MVVLLILGPALVGLLSLGLALGLLRKPKLKPQTGGRMAFSYFLLLITFGIGSCYAALATNGFGSGQPNAAPLALVLVILIALAAAAYLRGIARLPSNAERLREAFDVVVPGDGRGVAAGAVVCLGVVAVLIVIGLFCG